MKYPWLYEELAQKPGATQDFKEEWQWTRFLVGGKMFAAICKGEDGADALITLKLDPAEGRFFREQYEDILPGTPCGPTARCPTAWCGKWRRNPTAWCFPGSPRKSRRRSWGNEGPPKKLPPGL